LLDPTRDPGAQIALIFGNIFFCKNVRWQLKINFLFRWPVLRIRDLVPFWPLDPGSGIGFFRIPDLGSRIPNAYFWKLIDNFLGKKFYNSLKICPNFFLQHIKTKIMCNFVKFVAT
jgi:hypothetical protein